MTGGETWLAIAWLLTTMALPFVGTAGLEIGRMQAREEIENERRARR